MAHATAVQLIRREADLIKGQPWYGQESSDGYIRPYLNLTNAAIWALVGRIVPPRDLTQNQAEQLAELLDHLEEDLGDLWDWERRHAGDSSLDVASELRKTALRFELELSGGGA
jgi:hypothetical protein